MEDTEMTPEERERYDRVKREIEKKLEELDKKERLFEQGTANQQAHVSEQMEAFIEDVKTGKAFEGDHWRITTVKTGQTGLDEEWSRILGQKLDRLVRRERRIEWVKSKAMWLAAAALAAILLWALKVALN